MRRALCIFGFIAAACSSDTTTDTTDAGHDTSPVDVSIPTPDVAVDTSVADSAADSGTEDSSDVAVAAVDYCETTVDMFCDYYLRCGRMAATDLDDCRSTFLESCNAQYEPRYLSYVERGMLELSAEGIEQCRDHLATIDCDKQLFDLDLGCSDVWVGRQSLGESCAPGIGSFVCKPGTVCTLGLDLCGTCKVAAIVGDPCGGETRCETGAQCVDEMCVRRASPGESCSDAPCVTGADCVDDLCVGFDVVEVGDACDRDRRCPYKASCSGGVCVESALLGESCVDRDCASGWCDGGTCAELKEPGAPCTGPAECLSLVCDGDVCGPLQAQCFGD